MIEFCTIFTCPEKYWDPVVFQTFGIMAVIGVACMLYDRFKK